MTRTLTTPPPPPLPPPVSPWAGILQIISGSCGADKIHCCHQNIGHSRSLLQILSLNIDHVVLATHPSTPRGSGSGICRLCARRHGSLRRRSCRVKGAINFQDLENVPHSRMRRGREDNKSKGGFSRVLLSGRCVACRHVCMHGACVYACKHECMHVY